MDTSRDYGLCLARTDWDVPKHRGLSAFMVDLHQPGVEVVPIRLVSGSSDFCQEFFTDVVIPADRVVGEVNEGWTVASRLLLFERSAVGGGSPWAGGARGRGVGQGSTPSEPGSAPGRLGPDPEPGRRRPHPPAGGRSPCPRDGAGAALPAGIGGPAGRGTARPGERSPSS